MSIILIYISYDKTCTCIITTDLKRTIKVLCAWASGIPILKPEYIFSFKNTNDSNIEKYEWNIKSNDIVENCSKYWRTEKINTLNGSFYGLEY